jgi:hypothetical protein
MTSDMYIPSECSRPPLMEKPNVEFRAPAERERRIVRTLVVERDDMFDVTELVH